MPATPWAGTRQENQQLPDGSRLPAVLGPERVAGLVDQARVRFYAAA
jgi:hypothetical protein